MEIFVPDYDWNDRYGTIEEYLAEHAVAEGNVFSVVRLTVGANTTYRVKDGKAVPVSIAFPDKLQPVTNDDPGCEEVSNSGTPLVEEICPRCRCNMRKGLAIEQTFTGSPEWRGAEVCTMSPGGPGRLTECLKCEQCGYSVTG